METRHLLILLLLPSLLLAQEKPPVRAQPDTLKKRRIKFTTDIDQRFSLMQDQNQNIANVSIWGLRSGVLVMAKRPYKVGLGYYFLNTQTRNLRVERRNLACADCYATRNLDFGTVYFEPFWLRRRIWELSTPIEIGYGRASEHFYDNATETRRLSQSGSFMPAGLSLSASIRPPATKQWRVLRWFGLNGLVGYRYVLERSVLKADYDGLYYSVGLAFFLDRFTDDAARWQKVRKNRRAKK